MKKIIICIVNKYFNNKAIKIINKQYTSKTNHCDNKICKICYNNVGYEKIYLICLFYIIII